MAAIVLAAGAGSRFGYRPKGLLKRDGQPLVARQIDLLAQAGVRHVAVVLGHHAEAFGSALDATRAALPRGAHLDVVRNPRPDAGPGASLRCGLAALPPDAEGIVVLLADQPLLLCEDVSAVLHAWQARQQGIELVLPSYQGQPGHPLVFGLALRQWLAEQPEALGVRDWRRAHPGQVQALPVDHVRTTCDIDSEADLATLAATHGVALRWPT